MSDRVTAHSGSSRLEFDELFALLSRIEKRIAVLEKKAVNKPFDSGWSVTNLSTDRAVDGAANPELSALVNALIGAGLLGQ